MVNRVSPADRRAWGRVKDAGHRIQPTMPCIQMICRAYAAACSETLYIRIMSGSSARISTMAPSMKKYVDFISFFV